MSEKAFTSEAPETGKALYTACRSFWAYGKRIGVSVLLSSLFMAVGIICAVNGITLGLVAFAVPVVCALVLALTFVEARKYKIIFYANKVIVKSGLLNTSESQSVLTPIIGLSVRQSLGGKIFNYGDLLIDATGSWDINTRYVKSPYKLKVFLQTLIDSTDYGKIGMYITN